MRRAEPADKPESMLDPAAIVESYRHGAVSYIHKSQREGVFEHRMAEMFVYFSEHTKIPATAELPERTDNIEGATP